jgi:tetratricopeptide (TPR) repeat protein
MDKCLFQQSNGDEFSTKPSYSFKFRNLNNPSVYYDEVHRRFMESYRLVFLQYAVFTLEDKGDNAKCIRILDKMNQTISPDQFPLSYALEYQLAEIYAKAGAKKQAIDFADRSVRDALFVTDNSLENIERFARSFPPSEVVKRVNALKAIMK